MRGQLSRSKVVRVDRKLEKSGELGRKGFGRFARYGAPLLDSFSGDDHVEVAVLPSYLTAPRVAPPWLLAGIVFGQSLKIAVDLMSQREIEKV